MNSNYEIKITSHKKLIDKFNNPYYLVNVLETIEVPLKGMMNKWLPLILKRKKDGDWWLDTPKDKYGKQINPLTGQQEDKNAFLLDKRIRQFYLEEILKVIEQDNNLNPITSNNQKPNETFMPDVPKFPTLEDEENKNNINEDIVLEDIKF